MSKRHTASRRRTYGRRQHELHERLDRREQRRAQEWRASADGLDGLDPLGFESSSSQPRFGYAD